MTEHDSVISPDFRCGYVTIIGEPNVGKSTLLNGILQQKISIVTPKPQTTRHRILGILSSSTEQIIFLDTPGIIKPRYLLHEAMMQFALRATEDADILLFMIDATDPKVGSTLSHQEAFSRLRTTAKPVFLVINKVDRVKKHELLPVIEFYRNEFAFKEFFPISALKQEGIGELVRAIIPYLPFHPPLYPLDIVSNHEERFFVAEIIREKLFLTLKDEVPYSTTVDIIEFRDREGQKTFISADIYVERDSQKAIVIGKHGTTLKLIGQRARKDIEEFLQREVFVDLHVKSRKWREDKEWLSRLGYKPE